ncbi:TfuA-like core domain-containing protein [Labrys sp. KNU-23]|uniref:TfuA-like protein n=1 Tax=Labrys sp. KNU-23 TaxID=2789216 RepID=UPI0011ED290F|nr:TfuA-like protein [Labrys sp. KNU-23]QEN88339.1 TfuA-like core domain-containing protein [Labrys sp. KNU-23]
MTRILFTGPSLHGIEPGLLAGFTVRPPAGCGDVLAAAMTGVEAIGLVDGVFDHAPSVWHKEILYALSEGIPVYGAASMGALRGAECAAFGMIGVGRIFEDYASGRRVADADVGVAHAPAEFGYAPLSLALVDVEATLEAVAHALPAASREALLASARRIHFKERTWPDVVALSGLADAAAVEALLERHAVSQKQADALALLARMRADAGKPFAKPNFTLAQSGFFAVLRQRVEERLEDEAETDGA